MRAHIVVHMSDRGRVVGAAVSGGDAQKVLEAANIVRAYLVAANPPPKRSKPKPKPAHVGTAQNTGE